jgi:hypothetical protein
MSNALVDFFAMNGDVLRCIDADAYLVTPHADDRHGDVVADHHRLTHLSSQYQHGWSLALLVTVDADRENLDIHGTTSLLPAIASVGSPILRKSEYRVNAKAKSL